MKRLSSVVRRDRQRGVGSLEYIGIAGVTVILMGLAVNSMANYENSKVDSADAVQLQQVMQGALTYTEANETALIAAPTTVVPWSSIYTSMPGGINSSTLTNSFNQSYQLVVQRAGVAGSYTPNVMVQTVGGNVIPENRLRDIAKKTGGPGGFISSLSPTTATGAYGDWAVTSLASAYGSNPGTGHLAGALFYRSASDLTSAFIYRNPVTNHPEYNQMNTALDMGAQNVNNAAIVNATTVAASSVNASTAVTATTVNVSGDGSTANVHVGSGGVTYYGDLNGSSAIRSNSLFIQNEAGSGPGPIVSVSSIAASGQISTSANMYAAGNIQSSGWVLGSILQPTAGYSIGTGCGPSGIIATNGASPVFCVNGVWKGLGGGDGYYTGGSGQGTYGYVYNGNASAIEVQVWGGNNPGTNPCQLSAYTNTYGNVANSADNTSNLARQCFISFKVPANTYWEVSSNPYPNGNGLFYFSVFNPT